MFDTRVKENGKIDGLWYKNEYEKLWKQNNSLEKENQLLKEELTNLKNDITRVYNTMISLEEINKHELSNEDIEEI